MSNTNNSEELHDVLRKRLQDEIDIKNNSLETDDTNWFFESSSLTNQFLPIKAPSLASSNSTKAPPSISISDATVLPKSPKASSATTKPDSSVDNLVPLSRSKTADGRLSSPSPDETSADYFDNSVPLKRTSTTTSQSAFQNSNHFGHNDNNRRYSIGSVASTSSIGSDASSSSTKKRSFFKKMFSGGSSNKSRSRSSSIIASTPPESTTHTLPATTTVVSSSKFANSSFSPRSPPSSPPHLSNKQDSELSKLSSDSGSGSSSLPTTLEGFVEPKTHGSDRLFDNSAKTTVLNGMTISDLDPKLYQYLKDMDLSLLKHNDTSQDSLGDDNDTSTITSLASSKVSLSTKDSSASVPHYDKNTIPPHQDKPKLPSAFASHPRYSHIPVSNTIIKTPKPEARRETESSLFGSLLRRSKTNQEQNEGSASASVSSSMGISSSTNTPTFKYVKPPPKVAKEPPITMLREIAPLRKVAFATTTFVNDPPQQIPSRHPRKGNVEIGANNELIIHKIDPQELLNHASGIVVGGSGSLRLLNKDAQESEESQNGSAKDETQDSDSIKSQGMEKDGSKNLSMDKTINRKDMDDAATKARLPQSEEVNQESNNEKMKDIKDGIKIDKPMVRRRKLMEKPLVTLKIDELYTRCCHLREILPIPAVLKQIPKGSTEPLQILQLRNPRPSMIEVLSFSDFIRIAPVSCVSLDGVSLSVEMFRVLLGALLHKRYLEKLSLRNTPINTEGWKVLCWFITMNKSLKRLDITQCPSLAVSTQKLKSNKPRADDDLIMKCNLQNRSDMDWSLMTASLIARGGIEEIILTGCKINDLVVFQSFLNCGLARKTHKIGLAYNDLSYNQLEIVSKWLTNSKDIMGIDLGYNDLSNSLKTLIQYTKVRPNASVGLISLNSCNLQDGEEIEELFALLSKLPRLKYLDLSNNKKLFPSFVTKMTFYLPLFSKLSRLNLDNNDLTTTALISIAEILTLLRSLTYLSIKGNKLNEISCNALIKGIKRCPTLFTLDFDKDQAPQSFHEKVGLLTIRNMERALYLQTDDSSKGTTDLKTKSLTNLFTESANEFKTQMATLGFEKPFYEVMTDMVKGNKTLDPEKVSKFVEQTKVLLKSLHESINELMNLQIKNQLSFEGKEALVRLCVIDSSIETGLGLINSKLGNDYRNFSSKTNIVKNMVNFEGTSDNSNSSDSTGNRDETTTTEGMRKNSTQEDEAIEIKDEGFGSGVTMTRSSSAASLGMQKEEAAAFKITTSLKDKIKDKWASDKVSTEDIRESLLESKDVADFISAVEGLKKEGIDLVDIYKKNADSDGEDGDDEELKEKDDVELIRKEMEKAALEQSSEDREMFSKTWDNTIMNRRSETVDSELPLSPEVPGSSDTASNEILSHEESIKTAKEKEIEYDKLLEQLAKRKSVSN